MPPKRGPDPARNRNKEAQRLPGDRKTPSLAVGLSRRPHHIVSRLYPPWGSSSNGIAPRTSGAALDVAATAKAGTSSSVAAALVMMHESAATEEVDDTAHAHHGQGRAGLPTRVSGGDRGESVLTNGTASGRRAGGCRTLTARKRPRSTASTSFEAPAEVAEGVLDGSHNAEADAGRGIDALRNGRDEAQRIEAGQRLSEVPAKVEQLPPSSLSPSPALSLSPSPMVTERKTLKGGDAGGGGVVRDAGAHSLQASAVVSTAPHANERQGHCLPGTLTTTLSTSATSAAEEILVSPVILSSTAAPQKRPLHDTATSTADSKVLFVEDEDEETADREGQPWPLDRPSASSDGPWQPARAPVETHVLGELPESCSMTSARSRGLRRSLYTSPGSAVHSPQAGCAITESGKELRDEPVDKRRTDAMAISGDRAVLGGDEEDEESGRRASISCTAPSLKPTWVDPGAIDVAPLLEGCASNSAGATANLTETLAVRNLSLLSDESRGGADTTAGSLANGNGFERTPLLSLSTDHHVPYSVMAIAAAAARPCDDAPGTTAAEEALLGEELISPLAKRVTASPQQVTHNFEATAEVRAENRTAAASEAHTKVSSLRGSGLSRRASPTPPSATPCTFAPGGEARSLGRRMSVPSSSPVRGAAASVAAAQPAPPRLSLSPSPPSCSLPSTLDDGLWKESSSTAQAYFSDADAVATGDCLPKLHSESGDIPASPVSSVAVVQQQGTPIDPFLSTPPQLKRRSPARAKNDSGGGRARLQRSPPCSNRGGASKGGGCPAAPESLSRSPPRSAGQSAAAEASAITGADVDVQVLRVGTRVEGRWGREWFPAVIRKAPRNGFVQIEWEEDGSQLHVRLREVRLLPGVTDSKRAGPVSWDYAHKARTAPADGTATTEAKSDVLTATQLAALMEEEDAEDSRHEQEPPHIRSFPACREALLPRTTSAGTQMERGRSGASEMTGRDVDARALRVDHTCGATACEADAVDTDDEASLNRGNGARRSACAAGFHSPSRSPVPPGEVNPSSLCIFLPQTVRRALLQGEAPPPAVPLSSSSLFRHQGGPATELQRSTELQRILHFLASVGAVVVDSLAQADHMAAQIGDSDEMTAIPFTCAPPLLSAEQLHSASSPPAHGTGTASAVGGGGGRRKTVGRVPLTRRSAASSMAAASEVRRSLPTHFIFLVSSAESMVSGGAEVGEKLDQPHDVLPDVCLAHALGVSAIHASWIWGVVPGMARVKLPTPADQIERFPLADDGKGHGWKATSARAPATKKLSLPLRFVPLAVKDRWLSAKDVAFVVRDDRMEMWLNAAGATVTAEPVPSPPSHVACQTFSRGASRLSTAPAAASALAGRSLGSVHSRCQFESSPRSPLLKQRRAERTPDLVYVPDDAAVPVDLDRLGSVPALSVAWLADGIEQHYHRCCSSTMATEPGLPSPQTLASVRAAVPPGRPLKECHVRRSDTVSGPDRVQPSPSSPPLQPAAVEQKRGGSVEGAQSSKRAAVPIAGHGKEYRDRHDGLAVHPKSVPQRAECCKGGADGVASSAIPLSASDGDASEHVGRTVGTMRGSTSEEQAVMMRVSDGPCALSPPREAVKWASVGESGDTAKERIHTEAEEDIIPRPIGTTGATAVAASEVAAPTEPPLCTSHPVIALGEDYYFTMSAPPAPAPPPRPPSPPPHGPSLLHSPPLALPTTTIALGRVVDLQVETPPTSLLHQHLWVDGAASSFALAQPHCQCRVTLQLYEPKYMFMHIDPRSGEVVHQTTVYLARRWATVAGTSLLYDTPVYLITPAARPHVYLLEEEGEVPTPGMSDGTRHSPLRQQPVLGSVSMPPTADLSHGAARTMTDGISPLNFHGRRSRGTLAPSLTSERAARDGSDGGVNERQRHEWTLHAAETMRMTPTDDAPRPSTRFASAQRASSQRTPKQRTGVAAAEPEKAIRVAVFSGNEPASVPPTLSLVEMERSPPATVTGGDGTSPALRARPARQSQQQRMALGSSPRPTRLLAELPLQLGANDVVLRPNSHISFYLRNSLSRSQRPSQRRSLAPACGGGPHAHVRNGEDRRVVGPFALMNASELAAHATGEPAHRNAESNDSAVCDGASDTSEEIILEAPLIGQVELMREVEGRIDIVVHTPQPNSVFGGSKMFRITPDMIVEASP
ncbi:hypothetical protein LSCM1_03756 [Leishmania martiniquensis]|uniref:Uncharacterized protein n=1 Tax=Leishmania martiniquensis TaxID=1580590 RepID=A0A836KGX7_9TRYP|nr:hypothetical protein LSCM1_03756 [Leishmania martiniquensis]